MRGFSRSRCALSSAAHSVRASGDPTKFRGGAAPPLPYVEVCHSIPTTQMPLTPDHNPDLCCGGQDCGQPTATSGRPQRSVIYRPPLNRNLPTQRPCLNSDPQSLVCRLPRSALVLCLFLAWWRNRMPPCVVQTHRFPPPSFLCLNARGPSSPGPRFSTVSSSPVLEGRAPQAAHRPTFRSAHSATDSTGALRRVTYPSSEPCRDAAMDTCAAQAGNRSCQRHPA